MTYNYENGQVSKFALKRIETSCHKDENRTRLVGIMCRSCPYYEGMAERLVSRSPGQFLPTDADKYIVCNGFDKDDEGPNVAEIRYRIYERIENDALRAL